MEKVRKSIIVISVLTIFYSFYYWGIPAIINIEKRINFIEQKIEQKTGYKFKITEPKVKMGHTPAIWFMAENIVLLNNDNSKAINMNHNAIKIHLLPLLFGKVQIGNLSSDNIEINLIYTKNSELQLGQYKLEKLPKSNMSLSKAYFRIGNYRVNLKDLKVNKQISLDGSYLVLDEFKQNKKLKLSTFANLYVNKKASEIMADIDIKLPINKITENQFKLIGHVTNLDLKDFSDYVKSIPESKIVGLSGKINILADTTIQKNKHKNIFSKISIQGLEIAHQEKIKSIYCNDKLSMTMNANTIKNGISIRNLKILSKGIDLDINGELTNLNSKIPNTNLNIIINKSRTENFIPLMPGIEDIPPNANLLALKQNPFYGDIEGKLLAKGKADMPDITGNLIIKNGYINKPLNAPGANINLDFKGKFLTMDVEVPAPKNEKVFVKGDTELYGELKSDLMITSTDRVDLKSAQLVLNPLHQILKFKIGPVPIMDINGIGNIKLHVTGTNEKPHCFGYFNYNNTSASFLDIHNLVIKNANGTLDFDDINTHFYTKSATYNNKPISIDGKCNVKGILDFDVIAKEQDLSELLKIVKTSPMLAEIQQLFSPITSANGLCNFVLKLTGEIPDIQNIIFNKNLFAKGYIDLYSTNARFDNIFLSNLSGRIDFDNLNSKLDLTSNLVNSNMKISGSLNDKSADIQIISDKFILKDALNTLKLNIPYKDDIGNIHTSFIAKYNGNIDKISFKNLNMKGKIYASKSRNLFINNADFNISNSNLKLSKLKGIFNNSPFVIDLSINNLENPVYNGSFNIQNFNIHTLDTIRNYIGLKDFKSFSGIVSLKGQIKNNAITSDINLNNLSTTYSPEQIPLKIINGNLQIRNNNIQINKLNSTFGNMPVFINGKIYNALKSPNYNLSLSFHPTQDIVDQFFNNKNVYPIKLKGDIICTSNITGQKNRLQNKTYVRFNDTSSFYYMGATIGNSPVLISIDDVITPNNVRINNLQYSLVKSNQNNKPQLKNLATISGEIKALKNNNLQFNNLKIKTNEPTDAKIFNIIFTKPFMKQGQFTSDIIINGKTPTPNIVGQLNITDVDIPLFDSTIHDINLDIKKDKIYIKSKGTVLTNNLNISAIMKNKLNPPYIIENIKIHLINLDTNKLTETIRDFNVNDTQNKAKVNNSVDLSQIIVQNSEITADNIKIKDLDATNFNSHITTNEKMIMDIKDYKFYVADGLVYGKIKYNLLNNLFNLNMNIKDTNAQILSESLLGLKGQFYGSINSKIDLSCNGKSQDTCVQSANGKIDFEVQKGRMPKLGSLEYLLKAGNLVKSGITGLSITGIIDLITPYKTGDFDKIDGHINIANGIANDIKIYSSGKALNIYIKGTYNLTNQIANMQVYGALTKNFTTLFGKIGNASLNTLFNTIPWVNISEAPSVITEDIEHIPNIQENPSRMFNAVIFGDINGNDYVKSFSWLK